MDAFEATLVLLTELSREKAAALEQALAITVNQETVLQNRQHLPEQALFFQEMTKTKQGLIDQILQSDSAFQSAFDRVAEYFEQTAPCYPAQMKQLQEWVDKVTGLDVAIRVQEAKNKQLCSAQAPGASTPSIPKTHQSEVLRRYRQNAKQTGNFRGKP